MSGRHGVIGTLGVLLTVIATLAGGMVAPAQAENEREVVFTVLYDNTSARPELQPDWGFACLITGKDQTILFDTGTKPDVLLANMAKLDVRPESVDLVVLSHDHRDHTGGLRALLERHAAVSVLMPDAFSEAFAEEVRAMGARARRISGPTKIGDGLWLTGPLPGVAVEQSLAVETPEGLVVVTGCSHPGIVDIVRKVRTLSDQPIHLVFGGFHLRGASPGEVQQVIRALEALGVARVGPTHCTGEGPIQAFREAFGEGFQEMGAGRVVRLGGAIATGQKSRTKGDGSDQPEAARRDDVVWFQTGSLRGALVTAGQFDMNVPTLLPKAPPADLEQEGLDAETIVFTIRSLYLEKGEHRVIVDPGGLDDPGRLVTALRSAGIDPASIDTVIITHAHMDHCAGGVTAEGHAAFPHARYFLQKREWDHWMAPDNPEPHHVANFRRLLVPIRDRITLLEGDTEIVPGIEGVLTPGHSPGHMVVFVGKELAYTGDALLQPAHVTHPEWTATFDQWPAEVVESRRAFLARLAADGPLVVGTHFPAPGTGRVRAEGEGWRWVPETLPEAR